MLEREEEREGEGRGMRKERLPMSTISGGKKPRVPGYASLYVPSGLSSRLVVARLKSAIL